MKKLKNIRNIINIIFNLFTNCRNRSISLTYDGNVIVYFAYVLSINHFSLHFSFQIIFFFFLYFFLSFLFPWNETCFLLTRTEWTLFPIRAQSSSKHVSLNSSLPCIRTFLLLFILYKLTNLAVNIEFKRSSTDEHEKEREFF